MRTTLGLPVDLIDQALARIILRLVGLVPITAVFLRRAPL
jgi:hypothetical protein